ncbi:hypothetical protein RDI58_029999 [Solanum bulbocastanum]|uniref:Uncharacterized protein n=1 Tax=Solanum bulbocastanum TaxID=147425 RepID=A0AAN8Y095_SOLBU
MMDVLFKFTRCIFRWRISTKIALKFLPTDLLAGHKDFNAYLLCDSLVSPQHFMLWTACDPPCSYPDCCYLLFIHVQNLFCPAW